ncbi:MAG: hypothetical protein U9Q30_02040 [Campylobacterota bacterium]|nr:hypothetical protein [Campylobacterota bacterium]
MKLLTLSLLFTILFITYSFGEENISPKDIYVEYISYPKRVFTKQNFKIKLKATILKDKDSFNKIETSFSDHKNIKLISTPNWLQKSEKVYYLELFFKTEDTQFVLPRIFISLEQNNTIKSAISIKPPDVKFEEIAINQELFSNIIAKNIDILTVKTKQYNNNTLLTTINIKGQNSNLEETYIRNYESQGIKSLTSKVDTQNLFYYVMIPIHTKYIKFNYYNTIFKDFVPIKLPINLENELVSTQTDLNPNKSNIIIYYQLFLLSLIVISTVIYLLTKEEKYIFFIVVFIFILAYLFIPNKKILLNKGDKVYILPTQNSIVYKILTKKELVEVINEKKNYKKILFNNENVGWVKYDR